MFSGLLCLIRNHCFLDNKISKMSIVDWKENEIYLSYKDCLLRKNDVDVLRGPHWLTDLIIGLYLEYIEEQYELKKPRLLFISPELTQLMKLSSYQDYMFFFEPLKGNQKDYIFFPLNNNSKKDESGGSHWSLLVFSKNEMACYHFDSCQGFNKSIAHEFAGKLMRFFYQGPRGTFLEVQYPQQDNSYDCGLYVLCGIDIITEALQKGKKIPECRYDTLKELVLNKRKSLLELIDKLVEESKKPVDLCDE